MTQVEVHDEESGAMVWLPAEVIDTFYNDYDDNGGRFGA